jgi:hypothetical protein
MMIYQSIIADTLIECEKNQDNKADVMANNLMVLICIKKALFNYDIDSDLLTEAEINNMLSIANEICLKLANNSIY